MLSLSLSLTVPTVLSILVFSLLRFFSPFYFNTFFLLCMCLLYTIIFFCASIFLFINYIFLYFFTHIFLVSLLYLPPYNLSRFDILFYSTTNALFLKLLSMENRGQKGVSPLSTIFNLLFFFFLIL